MKTRESFKRFFQYPNDTAAQNVFIDAVVDIAKSVLVKAQEKKEDLADVSQLLEESFYEIFRELELPNNSSESILALVEKAGSKQASLATLLMYLNPSNSNVQITEIDTKAVPNKLLRLAETTNEERANKKEAIFNAIPKEYNTGCKDFNDLQKRGDIVIIDNKIYIVATNDPAKSSSPETRNALRNRLQLSLDLTSTFTAAHMGLLSGIEKYKQHKDAQVNLLHAQLDPLLEDNSPSSSFLRLKNLTLEAIKKKDLRALNAAVTELTEYHQRKRAGKKEPFEGVLFAATNIVQSDVKTGGDKQFDLNFFDSEAPSRAFNHAEIDTLPGIENRALYPEEDVTTLSSNTESVSKLFAAHTFAKIEAVDSMEAFFDQSGQLKSWIQPLLPEAQHKAISEFTQNLYKTAFDTISNEDEVLNQDTQEYFKKTKNIQDANKQYLLRDNLIAGMFQLAAGFKTAEHLPGYRSLLGKLLTHQGNNLINCRKTLQNFKAVSRESKFDAVKTKSETLQREFEKLLITIIKNAPKTLDQMTLLTQLAMQASEALKLQEEKQIVAALDNIATTITSLHDYNATTLNTYVAGIEKLSKIPEAQQIQKEYENIYAELFALKKFDQLKELAESINASADAITKVHNAVKDSKDHFDRTVRMKGIIDQQYRKACDLGFAYAEKALAFEANRDPSNPLNQSFLSRSRELHGSITENNKYEEIPKLTQFMFKGTVVLQKRDPVLTEKYMGSIAYADANVSKETKPAWRKWQRRVGTIFAILGAAVTLTVGIALTALTFGASGIIIGAILLAAAKAGGTALVTTLSGATTVAGTALVRSTESRSTAKRHGLFTQKILKQMSSNPLEQFLLEANSVSEAALRETMKKAEEDATKSSSVDPRLAYTQNVEALIPKKADIKIDAIHILLLEAMMDTTNEESNFYDFLSIAKNKLIADHPKFKGLTGGNPDAGKVKNIFSKDLEKLTNDGLEKLTSWVGKRFDKTERIELLKMIGVEKLNREQYTAAPSKKL